MNSTWLTSQNARRLAPYALAMTLAVLLVHTLGAADVSTADPGCEAACNDAQSTLPETTVVPPRTLATGRFVVEVAEPARGVPLYLAANPKETNRTTATRLTPELVALSAKIRRVLEIYYPRHQNTRDNTPWEVMHAIIAYGVDTQLFRGAPNGPKVNAIAWMSYNYPCANDQILLLNRGKIDARRGVNVQGHHGQLLAILAQSYVKSDYPMRVGGQDFTLADLIEHEMETCVAGEELTFKLISLSHYLDSDATWMSRNGQEWSIERLVTEELKQPIRGAACGGTHRLMGLSYSVKKRQQRNEPIDGEFARAQKFVQDYQRYTFSLQNPDGSFSTEWFVRRGDAKDLNRRLNTTGHTLEWLSYSLSDAELLDPRTVRAANYLATLLLNNTNRKWEIGPQGHSLHALSLYQAHVFGEVDNLQPAYVVEVPASQKPALLEARRPGMRAE